MVPPDTPSKRLVVQTRFVEHPYRKGAGVRIVDGRPKLYDDAGGRGPQIVREEVVCPACAGKS